MKKTPDELLDPEVLAKEPDPLKVITAMLQCKEKTLNRLAKDCLVKRVTAMLNDKTLKEKIDVLEKENRDVPRKVTGLPPCPTPRMSWYAVPAEYYIGEIPENVKAEMKAGDYIVYENWAWDPFLVRKVEGKDEYKIIMEWK